MASKFKDNKAVEINDENKDLIIEFCSSVYNHAKAKLNKSGHQLGPTFPTVVYGGNHKITHTFKNDVLVVYFKTEHGDFMVECVVSDK